MKIKGPLLAGLIFLSPASMAQVTSVYKSIEVGHMICYETKDLTKLAEYAADQNMAGVAGFISNGKCFINESTKPYEVYDYKPSRTVQAIVLPSGKFARAFTFSLK